MYSKNDGNQEIINDIDISNIFNKNDYLYDLIKKCKQKFILKKIYKIFFRRQKRKILERKSIILQKLNVADQWRTFINLYYSNQFKNIELKPKKEFSTQKIIWQYWAQGLDVETVPPLVQCCFNSVDKYSGDYKVIRLDINTVKDYLDIPHFIWEKKKNPQFIEAFFSDVLRLALLKNYGGIWIDATILLTQPIPNKILEQDLFFFQRTKKTENKEQWESYDHDYFGWSSHHNVNILNSFIVSKKNNLDIIIYLDLLLNYWKTQKTIPHYFLFQIMVNELIHDGIKQHQSLIIDDTLAHLLQVQLEKKFNMELYNQILSKASIHKLNHRIELNPGTFSDFIINQFNNKA